mgnify:CR=1 FL=1
MEQKPQELTLETAINVLISGIELAQKQGSYTLQESSALYNTIMKMKELLEKKEPTIKKNEEKETITM